jgi:YVTN family beta-propeller protein
MKRAAGTRPAGAVLGVVLLLCAVAVSLVASPSAASESATYRVHVTSNYDDTVAVVDGAPNTVIATVPVGDLQMRSWPIHR